MKATTRMMKLGLMMKVTTRKTKLSLINYLTNETRFNDELGEKERKEESQGQISYMSIKILFCSQDDISYTKILPSCKNEKSISKPSQEKLILCKKTESPSQNYHIESKSKLSHRKLKLLSCKNRKSKRDTRCHSCKCFHLL